MPKRPPKAWWNEKYREIKRGLRKAHPNWSAERLDQATRGTVGQIWHHELTPGQRVARTRKAEKGKDFGGWTSMNTDWERGYREGERKAEDRMRGINLRKNREHQLKQYDQLTYATEADNPVREEQKKQRRAGLRYRAGEKKEQHQGVGKVPVTPGTPTNPKSYSRDHPNLTCRQAHPYETHVKWAARKKMKWLRSDRYALFVPIGVKVATKSVGEVVRGDLMVEGFVSMPVKDLQGDVLELPALVKAKNTMTKAPHNLVWLDHESPYAKPVENQGTPPIGKFVAAKILRFKGFPALWVRMVVNKAHPKFSQVAYELKNGFYNAFSMEFVPIRGGVKFIRGKLANAIDDIKYFATSLVRAPANEGATITRVYQKAFANSLQFYPVRVTGPNWIGQIVRTKGVGKLREETRLKEAEPEDEPELEPEDEPEDEPENEPEEEPEEEPEPQESRMYPASRKDYDRETGSTAPERASTAIGEWGDPALDKARATLKDHFQRLAKVQKYHNQRLSNLEKAMKTIAANTAMIGKAVGVEVKGIDEDTPEVLDWADEGPGSGEIEESEPPEVQPGKLKPKKQRIVAGVEGGADEDVEYTDTQEVGAKFSRRAIAGLVQKMVDRAVAKKIVVRKGFSEHAGPVPESVKRMQTIQNDDGSIESQLAIIDACRG